MFKNLVFIIFISYFNYTSAQSNVKYGDDYIVFEAEDTLSNIPLQ